MNFWTTLLQRWSRPQPSRAALRLWPRRPLLELLEDRLLPSGTQLSKAVLDQFGKIPLSFEANQGQTDPQVQFLSRGSGYDATLTSAEAIFRPQQASMSASASPGQIIRLQFIGANVGAKALGLQENDARVEYQDVYRGINLVYYGNNAALEYDFVVSAGADPGAIALRFQGAQ